MSAPLEILAAILGAEQAGVALEALDSAGWVVVPRIPTQAMLDAAWASALAENAGGTWEDMIDAAQLSSGNSGSASG
jgi:hypothetical protein